MQVSLMAYELHPSAFPMEDASLVGTHLEFTFLLSRRGISRCSKGSCTQVRRRDQEMTASDP